MLNLQAIFMGSLGNWLQLSANKNTFLVVMAQLNITMPYDMTYDQNCWYIISQHSMLTCFTNNLVCIIFLVCLSASNVFKQQKIKFGNWSFGKYKTALVSFNNNIQDRNNSSSLIDILFIIIFVNYGEFITFPLESRLKSPETSLKPPNTF